MFTGRFGPQPVEVLFDRICRENGISHRHTGVRSPTTTGKIERFHQSLRREFLADRTFPSLEAARADLDGWVHSYNTERPHQSLEMATPAERFRLTPLATDAASIPVDAAEDHRGQWVLRRVGSNGVISVDNQSLPDRGGTERANGGRTTQRNGYPTRTWDTRVGTVELRVPKVVPGTYFPYIPLEAEGGQPFCQFVASRYERASIIVTSKKPIARWGKVFGGPSVAAAMIDRLVHHAEVIPLKGDSYRVKNRDLVKLGAV